MFKTNLSGGVCFEVKNYKYVCAGKTMATFELLMFKEDEIGTQGEIIQTEEKFSPAKLYSNMDEAIQEMIDLIEEKIRHDEWVQKTIKYNF